MMLKQRAQQAAPTLGLNVIGVGARTSLGFDLATSAAAARAGISNFSDHPFMIDQTGRPMIVARDTGLPIDLDVEDRFAQLVMAAATDCLAAIPPRADGRKLPLMVFLGLPETTRPCRPKQPSRLSKAIEQALADRAQVMGTRIMELGHIAGIESVYGAARALIEGFNGCYLVLGLDSWLDPINLEWLDETERLNAPAHPFGFVPGEAAVGVLLGSDRSIAGTSPKAWLEGCGLSAETDLAPENPRLGLALTKAARDALRPLNGRDQMVETVYADLNGLPERADEVGYALVRLSDHMFPGCRMVAPAEWFGDVGAATVPLMIALAVVAAEKGYGKGSKTLVLSQSMDSARGALLVALPYERTTA